MKKLLFFLVIIVVAGGLFIYLNPEYRAWFERQSDQLLPDEVTHSKAYRWRDRNGQWQLSDKPPAEGIDYEMVEYHKDTNVIPSEKLTGKSDE
ncbi:MAG: DUF4124 domain-containing protein [Thioalkalispiraceae bacterium]|jgi:hypothetical protein